MWSETKRNKTLKFHRKNGSVETEAEVYETIKVNYTIFMTRKIALLIDCGVNNGRHGSKKLTHEVTLA